MPGFLGGSSGSSGTGGEITFPKEFIDPVTKLRVSQPENLIDTDFEYGLQPTKWETVELINNTPSFFSKSGDTTIPGIVAISTNNGTREITVTTATDHGLAVGIPINVTGTKSVTADGSYVINSIPNLTTFTYLCKDEQLGNNSIEDLYSSIITGEFFQGSQIRIADAEGVTTDAEAVSTLTVKTDSTHGFGINTPFYFLNLNSTISQEFEASNTAAKSFDSSNSATAQTFDGSNSLSTFNIDWSNSATIGGTTSTISTVNTTNDTITVSHGAENFANQPLGTPLYYNLSVPASSGYFATNPRGVVFLKTTDALNSPAGTSVFQVSATPDGDAIDIVSSMSGTFQLANQARTFAGNNADPLTQRTITVIKDAEFAFDGGNQGFTGTETNGTATVLGYSDTVLVSVTAGAGLDYYVGAMVRYSTTGSAATGLVNNATYFINTFVASATPNLYNITLKALPNSASALTPTGGSGTQTFQKIGVSLDKDIVHIKNANFSVKDMVEYSFPVGGRFTTATLAESKLFYFVQTAYDAHNYQLSESVFSPITATGGAISEVTFRQSTYKVHTFTTVGNTNFVVSGAGSSGTVEYLIVGGGGGAGTDMGGGGGGGGFLTGTTTVTAQTYTITVGDGGASSAVGYAQNNPAGADGGNSSALGLTAIGGGGGGGGHRGDNMQNQAGRLGGSGGGAAGRMTNPGAGTSGQGFGGSFTGTEWNAGSGGGAGGAAAGIMPGPGRMSSILGTTYWFGGGGGRGGYTFIAGNGGVGGGGGGAGGASGNGNGYAGPLGLNLGGNGVPGFVGTGIIGGSGGANTGGGAGGHAHQGSSSAGARKGGSGIVVLRYPTTPVPDFVAATATGGATSTIVVSGITYRIHAFTTVGSTNFVVTNPGTWNDFDYLIVGGGGGGGGWGGGGGAGGVRTGKSILAAQTYPIVVGGGGAPGTSAYSGGGLGGVSSAFGITAGGGGGGGWYSGNNGIAGASGGGGGLAEGGGGGGAGGAGNTPSVFPSQGNPGGSGGNNPSGAWDTNRAGGGGGAGERGYDGAGTGPDAGRGGRGLDFSSMFGTAYGESGWFGGGGGGHSGVNAGGGVLSTAGQGGGGRGGRHAGGGGTAALSGTANTGGGGGGAWGGNAQEAIGGGGSGIVLIRYPIAIA
jgi:hypothetical protein